MADQGFSLLVQDVGEQALLQRLQRFCPQSVVGDDAAVMPLKDLGQSLVATTDVLVNGVHFSDRTTSPEDAGWRAAAANLSDLAAMGASPLGITVGLSLTGNVEISWVERLYQGITDCLGRYNTPLVGGDVCRSPVVSLAITAFGQVFEDRVLRRSAAQSGDAIVVTGIHGASRAGLELLLDLEAGKHLNQAERNSLILAHQRPQPRLDVLPLLDEFFDAPPRLSTGNSHFSIAGMDSSDGLADAVLQICRASGVGAIIDKSSVPQPSALSKMTSPDQAWDWILYGGEDFELVLCLPTEPAKTLVEKLGEGGACIGYITAEKKVLLRDSFGTHADVELTLEEGFQHF